jgi:hypothetical protein
MMGTNNQGDIESASNISLLLIETHPYNKILFLGVNRSVTSD